MTMPESHLAQEAIAALVDGELGSGPAARAARHLAGCLSCRMAVQAQREAKDALHASTDVDVPGDLLSRLNAIPFTAEVPGLGGSGSWRAGPGSVTVDDGRSAFSVSLAPRPSAGSARWLRRSLAGTLAGIGVGVTALALNLPADPSAGSPSSPVAGTGVRSVVVPPVVRTISTQTAPTIAPSVVLPVVDRSGNP